MWYIRGDSRVDSDLHNHTVRRLASPLSRHMTANRVGCKASSRCGNWELGTRFRNRRDDIKKGKSISELESKLGV